MLIFPLKKEWYEKIKSGEKTVEYREVKSYWTKRLFPDIPEDLAGEPRRCYLQFGYTRQRLEAWINKIEIIDGKDTDLHIDKLVYAIHLTDVREVEE